MRGRSLLPLLAFATPTSAIDVGQIGPTYPIREPHLIEFIQQRLKAKEISGELQQLQAAARARAVATITNPPAVAGLAPTKAARTFYYDPTFVLDRNLLDANGAVLFAAGTRKNPLEIVSLTQRLLFFDARDRRQIAQARRLIDSFDGKVKPILVGGSYLDLMKAWRVPVYFDQQGALTRQLGITQVPALVSQEGLRLRIDEMVL